ncbi:MAG: hypothetical protein M1839_005802 [Geoglossum umbratile]|nr:MAG: hypothetical protein M1839_005802 [Geoglossum umbratile]
MAATTFPTVPAFVHIGDWNDQTRKHPATKMMEIITNKFDQSCVSDPRWYAADSSFHNADGSDYRGLEKTNLAVKQSYERFTSHYHEPHSIVCIEAHDGYKMWGQAKLFGNLPGVPAEGEKKVKDRLGREWDVCIPGGYFNYYVRDERAEPGLGMVIKRAEVAADSSIVERIISKRG